MKWKFVTAASAPTPAARLKAMTDGGVDCAVLYPSLAGFSGERFGAIADAELEAVVVQRGQGKYSERI